MDTVANLLSQIRNAYQAHHDQIETNWSKLRQALAELLAKEGYVNDVKVEKVDKIKKKLVIKLRYDKQNRPMITKVKRVSKPGRRVYTTVDKIPVTLGGMGTTILSTSKGLMIGQKARKENLGGEIICQIY